MGEPTDNTQLHRAIANTIWPHLRAGDHGWKRYRETRIVTPTGNTNGGRYSSVPPTENPSTYLEVISTSYKIITTLWSDDHPGEGSWRITLNKHDADATLSRLNAAAIADYELALEHAACRKPFTVERNENGERYLTRNRHDGTITNLAAAALEVVAGACGLRRIPADVEAALFTDEDDISLDAIRAALQLAGGEEP